MLDTLSQPMPSQVIVDIAPASNALNSLTTVAIAREFPGIDAWAVETCEKLSDEEREQIQIISMWIGAEALINIVTDEPARSSFSAYLEAISACEPKALRDGLFTWMTSSEGARLSYVQKRDVEHPKTLLESRDAFAAHFLRPKKWLKDVKTSDRVYDLFIDPPALKSLLVGCLNNFWETHLKEEWERRLPEVQEAVQGFKQIDLSGMNYYEVTEAITRRDFRGVYRPEVLQDIAVLRFIPSPHNGPYVLKTSNGEELQITFGAYHLSELARGSDTLEGIQMVEHLKALSDKTRLEMIQAIKTEREMGTQEIIDRFQLSKSTASRHIRQLVSTGILIVRVEKDGLSKIYRLNPAFKTQMQEMLKNLLG
jgi:DNA-binding transcriptional ArsR family regulator